MPAQVTLNDEDVEWIRSDDFKELSEVIWVDEDFRDYVLERGLDQAMDDVARFHRHIANQLIRRAVMEKGEPGSWEARTINLCNRIKWRRNQLRASLRERDGLPAAKAFIERLIVKYPRAEWGSALDAA